MKFTIDRKPFLELVHTVYPSVDQKGTLPSLSYIRMEAAKGGLVLAATNIVTTTKSYRKANTLETGVVVVPGKTLNDIVSNVNAESFGVELEKTRLTIRAGKSAFHVHTLDADHFPPIPDYGKFQFRPLIKEFFDNINRVVFSASRDESRAHLQAVYIQPSEMVATDGHRMSILQSEFPSEHPLLVHRDSFLTLTKVFSSSGGKDIQVAVDEGHIHFRTDDTASTVKLMQGTYVDYALVIPKGECQVVEVQRTALREAIKLVTLVSGKTNQVRFDLKDGRMKLTSYSESIGEATDSVECQHHKDFTFALNARYLDQVLDHLKEDVVKIELRESRSPIVIRENGYVSVVMPQSVASGG